MDLYIPSQYHQYCYFKYLDKVNGFFFFFGYRNKDKERKIKIEKKEFERLIWVELV